MKCYQRPKISTGSGCGDSGGAVGGSSGAVKGKSDDVKGDGGEIKGRRQLSQSARGCRKLAQCPVTRPSPFCPARSHIPPLRRPLPPIDAWTVADPAIRQLYCGTRRRYFPGHQRIALKREEREDGEEQEEEPPPPRVEHNITGQGRRSDMSYLAFLKEKSLKAKGKADERLQAMERALGAVVIKQPNRRLQKVLAMSPLRRRVDRAAGMRDGIPLGEFISQVVGQLLKQARVEVPVLLHGSLVSRLTDVIVDEAVDWNVTEADGVTVKIREMLERDSLKRILADFGVQMTQEMLDVGDQLLTAAAAGKPIPPIPRDKVPGRTRDSLSVVRIEGSEFDSDSQMNVSEFTESEHVGFGVEDRMAVLSQMSFGDFYSDGSDLLYATGPQKLPLLRGSLEDLPPTQKRVVRVYLCSNFSDMIDERNWIMRTAVPKLQEFARQSLLDFQVVDLRWGLGEETAYEPENLPVYFEQIENCRKISSGPFFVVLLGNKYGHAELPLMLPVALFQSFEKVWSNVKILNAELLQEWYELDRNAVPPVYCLQPVSSKIPSYGIMEYGIYNEQLRKSAARQWLKIEQNMRDAIDRTLLACQDQGVGASEDVVEMLAKSGLEREVQLAMTTLSARFCICYSRHIEGLEFHIDDEKAPTFIDIIDRNEQRMVDRGKQRRIEALKQSLERTKEVMAKRNQKKNVQRSWSHGEWEETAPKRSTEDLTTIIARQEAKGFEDQLYLQQYIIDWEENTDSKTLTAEQRAFLKAENEIYLEQLTKDFIHDCKEMIATFAIDKLRTSKIVNQVEEEVVQQARHCNDLTGSSCCPDVYDLDDVRTRLDLCVEQRCPLIVHGDMGSGVSTLVALINYNLRGWYGSNIVNVVRFVGTTPASMKVSDILTILARQLSEVFETPTPKSAVECSDLNAYFTRILRDASLRLGDSGRLFILLDGLDRLKPDEDNSHCLSWLPKVYPPRIQLVVSACNQNDVVMRNLRNAFKVRRSYVEVHPLRKSAAEQIIQTILERKSRTVTSEQMTSVLQAISGCPRPIFVALLMQEAVAWKSSLDMRQYKLPESVERALMGVFGRLESKLGTIFVRHAIAMLTISDGGLSELEWEDALACDDDVLDEAFQYMDPPTTVIRCPQLYMARLRHHLSDLLTVQDDRGLPVFCWSNRAVESAVYKSYLQTDEDKFSEIYYHCYHVLAELFHAEEPIARTLYLRKRKLTIENANRQTAARRLTPGNRRKLQKLPSFIYRSASETTVLQEYKEKIVCNMSWLLTKLRGRPYSEVLKDFEMVRQKDDDVLMVYGILQTEAEAIREHPELLQLEILSRFSKIPKSNSVCIDRLVASSRNLLTSTTLTLLYPFYPCVPTVDLSLRLSKLGPTHLLGVYDRQLGVVWGPDLGLEIWQLMPTHRILYHLYNAPNLSDVILSPDCSLVFCVNGVTLYKWTVSTGTLVGQCDLATQSSVEAVPPSGLGLLSPLVADEGNTRVAVRANVRETQLDGCGLVIVDSVKMTVLGSLLETSFGSDIANAEFYGNDSLFVTQTHIPSSGKPASRVLLFDRLPSRAVTAVVNLPPRLRDVPGCFKGRSDRNSIYLGCLSDPGQWERLECEMGLGTVSRKMIGMKITDVGLVIVVFACVADDGYSVLAVLDSDGKYRSHCVSKVGLASCMELTNDHANVFIGYRSVGMVEVYDLPDARLAHSFLAHAGADVNCIREVDTWQVYTTGSDATFCLFDLSVTSLAMDFTKKSPRRFDDESVLTDEDVYVGRSVGVRMVDMSRSEHAANRIVICYESQDPVIAEIHSCFTCHSLQMPPDVAEVHCAWFAVDDTLVIGLGSPKDPNKASGASKIVLTWHAHNRRIIERETIYADDCCLSKDRQSIALIRRRKTGTSMAVFRLKTNEKIRKYRSCRTVDLGLRLLTDNCRYLISIEPHDNCIVVFKLLPRDIESVQEDYSALSESDPNDDATCSDSAYDYDERSPQRRMSRIQQEMMLKTIVERENEYSLFDDYPAQSKSSRKTRFLLRVHANPEAVVVNRNDTLMVGSNQGHVLFFYLNQMYDGIHNFYSALNLHDREITVVSLSLNERYVLTGSKDNKMKVYDLWENDTQSTLTGHTNAIQSIATSTRNQFVASGSKDNTIRLWNLLTGRRLTTFCACMDIYRVLMFRQRGDTLKVLALADRKGRKKLMLFRSLNLVTTNKRENF